MSREYRMSLTIESFNPHKQPEIEAAAEEVWPFDNWTRRHSKIQGLQYVPWNYLSAQGDANLNNGESEEQFANRLAAAIFAANAGPCTVHVMPILLEFDKGITIDAKNAPPWQHLIKKEEDL